MKHMNVRRLAAALTLVVAGSALAGPTSASFTYQGRLRDAGILRTQTYDFIFELVDPDVAAPQPTLASVARNDLVVTTGLFTTTLDFPATQFVGQKRALRIRVRPGTSVGAYTTLPGLQELTVTPYALFALNSGTSLQGAYNNGRTIDSSAGPIQFRGPAGVNQLQGFDAAGTQLQWRLGNDDFGDPNGELVLANNGSPVIELDGSDTGSGNPFFTMFGLSSSFGVYLDVTGTNSVTLPGNAISAPEIADEPGVAANRSDVIVSLDSTIGYQTVLARTINAPTAGYVVAIASGYASVNHSSGTPSSAFFGLSLSSSSVPSAQDVDLVLPAPLPSGLYSFPLATNEVFAVPAGATTVYFLMDRGTATGGVTGIADHKLSLIFIPTAYGSLTDGGARMPPGTPDHALIAPAWSDDDIQAERYQSWQADQARLRTELADMQRQLEELRARVEGNNR